MFTIKKASNLRWTNAEHTAIDLDVTFAEFDGVMPFTAHPDDVHDHGVELFRRANGGEFGRVQDYIEPPPPPPPTPPDLIMARTSKPSMEQLYEIISRLQ